MEWREGRRESERPEPHAVAHEEREAQVPYQPWAGQSHLFSKGVLQVVPWTRDRGQDLARHLPHGGDEAQRRIGT